MVFGLIASSDELKISSRFRKKKGMWICWEILGYLGGKLKSPEILGLSGYGIYWEKLGALKKAAYA
jgi:hypothetical protein